MRCSRLRTPTAMHELLICRVLILQVEAIAQAREACVCQVRISAQVTSQARSGVNGCWRNWGTSAATDLSNGGRQTPQIGAGDRSAAQHKDGGCDSRRNGNNIA